MSGYNELVAKDQRLVVLRTLLAAPSYSANETVIGVSLERFGHKVSRVVVAGLLDWLDEAGLIRLEEVTDTLRVATLSRRGQDVAEGRAKYSGVNRPSARG